MTNCKSRVYRSYWLPTEFWFAISELRYFVGFAEDAVRVVHGLNYDVDGLQEAIGFFDAIVDEVFQQPENG